MPKYIIIQPEKPPDDKPAMSVIMCDTTNEDEVIIKNNVNLLGHIFNWDKAYTEKIVVEVAFYTINGKPHGDVEVYYNGTNSDRLKWRECITWLDVIIKHLDNDYWENRQLLKRCMQLIVAKVLLSDNELGGTKLPTQRF